MKDIYIIIMLYTLIVMITSFWGGFKIASIIYNYKREKEYLNAKCNAGSLYGKSVYSEELYK